MLPTNKPNEASKLIWENTACDWCGSKETNHLFKGNDLLMGLPGEFCLVECLNCGLLRQNPRLTWESLQHYYTDEYSAYKPIIATERSNLKRFDRRYGMLKRLRAIEKHQSGGQLLDVGSGTGIFLAEAQRNPKWKLTGIEPNPSAANYSREHLNFPIHQGRFSEIDLSPETYDVITMWNVVEHLKHPITDIRKAYQLLKQDGWFVFSLPNTSSWEARFMGQFWLGWDLPRHLYLFPMHLLNSILASTGFLIKDTRCIAGAHAAFGLSINFWLKAHKPEAVRLRSLIQQIYLSFPSRLLLATPFWISDRLRASSLITVFAQKSMEP